MRQDAFFDRYQLFIAAATVGAHANSSNQGFRQRDVKFLIELFSNWVEHSLRFRSFVLQNTQVARFLESLVSDGFARKINRTSHPQYRLTRSGLLDLLSRMVHEDHYERPERFLFVYYFCSCYSERISQLVWKEGKQFSPILEIELRELLDTEKLKMRELQKAEKELQKIDIKISEGMKSSKLAVDGFKSGLSAIQIVKEIEKLFPYELNSEKPLSELYEELPEESRKWELEIGNVRRAELLWIPSRALLVQYIKLLRGLD